MPFQLFLAKILHLKLLINVADQKNQDLTRSLFYNIAGEDLHKYVKLCKNFVFKLSFINSALTKFCRLCQIFFKFCCPANPNNPHNKQSVHFEAMTSCLPNLSSLIVTCQDTKYIINWPPVHKRLPIAVLHQRYHNMIDQI